jgi:hypothetical protein
MNEVLISLIWILRMFVEYVRIKENNKNWAVFNMYEKKLDI